MNLRLRHLSSVSIVALVMLLGRTAAAAPTVEQALRLAPIQKDVDYDKVAPDDVAKCTIKSEKIMGQTGWVVRGPNGELLRQFVDTNNDNVVDRWSYFKDGVEVYRDIDENFNGKADQHRWMNVAGTRWGVDKAEDGKVDSWKVISAEEVTAELVIALRDRDEARFTRLLISPNELKNLGLGPDKYKETVNKVATAITKFKDLAAKQKLISAKTTWQYFAATRPALVPAGTDESTADLQVYENVVAMIETGSEHGQLQVGAMVKVGEVWRLVDLPVLPGADGKLGEVPYAFMPGPAPLANNARGGTEAIPRGNEELQALLQKLETVDKEANTATGDRLAKANDDRADLLQQLADADQPHRGEWLRQLADVMSAAVQGGNYPDGVERLRKLSDKLEKSGDDTELAAHARFCYLAADYNYSLSNAKENIFAETQKIWVTNLEQFVKDFPRTTDTPEALLQLGIAEEFGGQEERAKKWYALLVGNFKDAPSYRKANGALRRLESVGKPISISGRGLKNEPVDLTKLKGKVVLIQYWATWCEPCKTDMAQIKELKAKYGKNFDVVGVSLDSDKQSAVGFLQKNPMPWATLWDQGGLDSSYANDMGILTLPTMILVDGRGNVVNRGVHITELDNELRNLLK